MSGEKSKSEALKMHSVNNKLNKITSTMIHNEQKNLL